VANPTSVGPAALAVGAIVDGDDEFAEGVHAVLQGHGGSTELNKNRVRRHRGTFELRGQPQVGEGLVLMLSHRIPRV